MSSERPARTHPALWVPTLYFAEGLPFFAVSLLAGILYKRLGITTVRLKVEQFQLVRRSLDFGFQIVARKYL